jgi:hypothetical protein
MPRRPPILVGDMANFAFIHGAGDVGWYWHLVEAELRALGHDTVAPDLPIENGKAGLTEYATAVVDAIDDRREAVVVAQSFGGYTARSSPIESLPGSSFSSPRWSHRPVNRPTRMFANTRWEPEQLEDSSALAVFYHDVPHELADEALTRGRRQSDTPGREPWPLGAWPDIETRFVLCRNDRFFPARWLRPLVRDRLGIEPDEIDSGHCPALSRPQELAGLLDRYSTETPGTDRSA